MPAASSPHGVSVGASAMVLAHVPRWPARLHCSCGPVHAVLQQTPSTQKPVEHPTGVEHAPPCGIPVLVGVAVGVLVTVAVLVAVDVAVAVAVAVAVPVAVLVAVVVAVAVAVPVAVAVGTATPSMKLQFPNCPTPQVASESLAFDIGTGHTPGPEPAQLLGVTVVEHLTTIGFAQVIEQQLADATAGLTPNHSPNAAMKQSLRIGPPFASCAVCLRNSAAMQRAAAA